MTRRDPEYMQTLYRNLKNLEPFLTNGDQLESNVEYLARFVNQYLSVCRVALVRITEQGEMGDYASWSENGGFLNEIFEHYVRKHLPWLLETLQNDTVLRNETVETLLEQSVGLETLTYHPIVVPVEGRKGPVGFAYFGKRREDGPWSGQEAELLRVICLFVGFWLSGVNMEEACALKSWVFDELMDNLRAYLYVTDPETDRILFMNGNMKKAFGLEQPEGKICWQVLQEGREGRCEFCPVGLLNEQNPSCVWEEKNSKTGRVYENYDSMMTWIDGRTVHFQQSTDITDARLMVDAANRDELTGLLSRRAGKEKLQEALSNAKKERAVLTVCLYDMNVLKEVNDTYGHLEGDQMLKIASRTVQGAMEGRDFVFRLSGDEFIICFYGMDAGAASERMSELQGLLFQAKEREQKPYDISFCYGCLEVGPDDEYTLPEIFAQVDENMYRYKRQFHRSRMNTEQARLAAAGFTYDKDRLYEALIQSTDSYIYICNMQTGVFRFPPAMVEEFDLPGEIIYNASPIWGSLIHKDDRAAFFRSMQELEEGRETVHDQRYRVLNRRGEWVPVRCRGRVISDENGEPALFAGVITVLDASPAEDRRRELLRQQRVSMGEGARRREARREELGQALRNRYTEIYEYDFATDRLSLLFRNAEILEPIIYTGDMQKDVQAMSRQGIHPDDRRSYLAFYDSAHLRGILEGRPELDTEYRRLGRDGKYRWVASSVLPLPSGEGDKAMILIKDVTERKRAEQREKALENRLRFVFNKSYDVLSEINLADGTYVQSICAGGGPEEGERRDCRETFRRMVEGELVKEDAERFQRVFDLPALRAACESGSGEIDLQYRIHARDGGVRWLENRVHFVRDEQTPTAVVTVRDITMEKEREKERRVAEKYDAALRGIYDELYEINVSRDRYRIVYHDQSKYVTPPEEGRLSEAIPLVAGNMIHPGDRERFLSFFNLRNIRAAFAEGRESLIGEFRKLWIDQRYHWASLTVFPVAGEEGEELLLCLIMDIDEKKRADEIAEQNRKLVQQKMDGERYRIVVEQTGTMVCEWNAETGVRYIPRRMIEQFAGDYSQNDKRLQQIWLEGGVVYPKDVPEMERFLCAFEEGERYAETTARLLKRDGSYHWCRISMSGVWSEDGKLQRIITTINDVDQATKARKALEYRAQYDSLTGLYNIDTFYARAQQLLYGHPNKRYALLRLDVGQFKVVNRLYGMEEGDKLLECIARILERSLRPEEVCGRMGGDVFCVLRGYERERELEELAARITAELAEYPLGYKVTPYFGVCVVEDPQTPVNLLCDWAGNALKTVKGNVLRNLAFYDEALRARQLSERRIESEMENALKEGQFQLYLQPKCSAIDGRVVGAEALSRWVRPEEGMLAPDLYIPLFEKNGFIVRLDEYIWEQTCKLMRHWLDNGYEPLPVSVNVSRIHVYNQKFSDKILALAEKYRLPHHLLEFELTESAFVDNVGSLSENMSKLQKAGFRFLLDDFGSGYSSLNMLWEVPVSAIKLDRGFFGRTAGSKQGRTVISSTIALARKLGLDVIPEGVETAGQLAFLREAGCKVVQGFYFAPPQPVEEFERYCRENGGLRKK